MDSNTYTTLTLFVREGFSSTRKTNKIERETTVPGVESTEFWNEHQGSVWAGIYGPATITRVEDGVVVDTQSWYGIDDFALGTPIR